MYACMWVGKQFVCTHENTIRNVGAKTRINIFYIIFAIWSTIKFTLNVAWSSS